MKKFLGERGQSIGDFSTACDVGYKNTTNVLSIFSQDLQGETVGKRRSVARR
jgi:hypothetical protein